MFQESIVISRNSISVLYGISVFRCVFVFGGRHFCICLALKEGFMGLLSVEGASVRLFSSTPPPPLMRVFFLGGLTDRFFLVTWDLRFSQLVLWQVTCHKRYWVDSRLHGVLFLVGVPTLLTGSGKVIFQWSQAVYFFHCSRFLVARGASLCSLPSLEPRYIVQRREEGREPADLRKSGPPSRPACSCS